MNRKQILTTGIVLTLGVTAAVAGADYLLTQETQEVEESLGVYQEEAYAIGVQIEKVEGANDSAASE